MNGTGGHTTEAFGLFQRERLNRPPIVIKTRSGMVDKRPIVPTLGDDFPPHGVGHHDISTDI